MDLGPGDRIFYKADAPLCPGTLHAAAVLFYEDVVGFGPNFAVSPLYASVVDNSGNPVWLLSPSPGLVDFVAAVMPCASIIGLDDNFSTETLNATEDGVVLGNGGLDTIHVTGLNNYV